MRIGITKRVTFSAKHQLPFHQGQCARDHGHNYAVEFTVYGPIIQRRTSDDRRPDAGMVMDFGELKDHLAPLLAQLDHYSLNDAERARQGVEPLGLPDDNPTAEHLAVWFLKRLPMVHKVVVWETDTCWATAERDILPAEE